MWTSAVIAQDVYGIDAYQFGVVVVLSLVVGLLTPPVGAALYVSAGIAEVPPFALFRQVLPYISAAILVILLLCVFPSLSTVFV